jgi:hypothetical protein
VTWQTENAKGKMVVPSTGLPHLTLVLAFTSALGTPRTPAKNSDTVFADAPDSLAPAVTVTVRFCFVQSDGLYVAQSVDSVLVCQVSSQRRRNGTIGVGVILGAFLRHHECGSVGTVLQLRSFCVKLGNVDGQGCKSEHHYHENGDNDRDSARSPSAEDR